MRDARQDQLNYSPNRQRKKWTLAFFLWLLILLFMCSMWLYNRKNPALGHLLLIWVPLVLFSAYMAFRPRTAREDLQNWVCDTRHCGRCGYDLTGNVSGICPECGTPIPDSQKQIQKPWWGSWWIHWQIDYLDNWRKTLAYTAIAAVFCAFCAALTFYIAIRWHQWAGMAVALGLLSVNMAINCIRIVQYRRRIGGR